MKKCSACQVFKHMSDFHRNPCRGDGLSNNCKICCSLIAARTRSKDVTKHREACRKSYHKNKFKHKEQIAAKVKTPEGKFTRYKVDAKTRGFEFSLDINTFKFLVTSPCSYCGSLGNPINGVDRLDSKIGYLTDNVVSCCYMCNIMKHKFSLESFLNQIELIHTYRRNTCLSTIVL